jgi:hypothetical protein
VSLRFVPSKRGSRQVHVSSSSSRDIDYFQIQLLRVRWCALAPVRSPVEQKAEAQRLMDGSRVFRVSVVTEFSYLSICVSRESLSALNWEGVNEAVKTKTLPRTRYVLVVFGATNTPLFLAFPLLFSIIPSSSFFSKEMANLVMVFALAETTTKGSSIWTCVLGLPFLSKRIVQILDGSFPWLPALLQRFIAHMGTKVANPYYMAGACGEKLKRHDSGPMCEGPDSSDTCQKIVVSMYMVGACEFVGIRTALLPLFSSHSLPCPVSTIDQKWFMNWP